MRLIASVAIGFVLTVTSFAQSQGDVCHVYVVDSALAERYWDASDKVQQRMAKSVETLFPEFRPTIGEEELTTKTYRFPHSRLFITASVYYTDESLRSVRSGDSIMVAVVVSGKRRRDAISADNNTVAEATYTGEPITVKARTFVLVKGRRYAVGIECHCQEKVESK